MKHREEKAESQRQEPEARTKGRKAKGTRPGNKKQENRKHKKTGNRRQRRVRVRKSAARGQSQHTRGETKKPAQDQGLVRPSVARCFGVARRRFWSFEGCNLVLVSCRFRKQR